jgi:hypothetical protein
MSSDDAMALIDLRHAAATGFDAFLSAYNQGRRMNAPPVAHISVVRYHRGFPDPSKGPFCTAQRKQLRTRRSVAFHPSQTPAACVRKGSNRERFKSGTRNCLYLLLFAPDLPLAGRKML